MSVVTFNIPNKLLGVDKDDRYYIARDSGVDYVGVGRAEGYWRSAIEAKGAARALINEGERVDMVIKVSVSGREYFSLENVRKKQDNYKDFGSW